LSSKQEKIRLKRESNKEQAKSDAEDRLHRFLINWGRTPGSTLKGIVEAGYELSNQQGLDKKEQRRMEKELDDISSALSKAEYERQIGDYDKAKESITKAGQQYYELGIKKAKIVTDYKIKTMESADKLEIARLKAEKLGSKPADVQLVDSYFQGLIAEGYPADAKTYNEAIRQFCKIKPTGQITAATIAQSNKPEENLLRGRDIANKERETDTRASDAKRKQIGDFKDDLYDALRDKDVKKELKNAKTPEAKAAIKDRVKQQVLGGFDLLSPKDVGLAGGAAPASNPNSVRSAADAILSGGR